MPVQKYFLVYVFMYFWFNFYTPPFYGLICCFKARPTVARKMRNFGGLNFDMGEDSPSPPIFYLFLHFSAFFGKKILRDAFSIADHTIRALTWYIIVFSLWFSCRNGIGFFQIIFKSESGPIRMNLIRNRSESEQKSMNPIRSDPKSDRIRISDRTAHLY